MLKRLSHYLLACSALLLGSNAMAALVQYEITGQWSDNSNMVGTLTVDQSSGLATAADIQLSSPLSASFTDIVAQGVALVGVYEITIETGSSVYPQLNIALVIGNSEDNLKNLQDGDLFGGSSIFTSSSDFLELNFGNVKLDSSVPPIPLPASVFLFASALAGLGLSKRRAARQKA